MRTWRGTGLCCGPQADQRQQHCRDGFGVLHAQSDQELPFRKMRASHLPVYDFAHFATASGVPDTTTSPPRPPPSGPKSIIQSAVLITSMLCSITSTEPPASISLRKDASSLLTSSKWSPVVGSSKM